MRPRGREMTIVAAVVFLFNLQRQHCKNLTFLWERMIGDLAQGSEDLFVTSFLRITIR